MGHGGITACSSAGGPEDGSKVLSWSDSVSGQSGHLDHWPHGASNTTKTYKDVKQ